MISSRSEGQESISSVHVFGDRRLPKSMRNANNWTKTQCNACKLNVAQVGDLSEHGRVWYCPSATVNILSLKGVQIRFMVMYNSKDGVSFTLHKADGT